MKSLPFIFLSMTALLLALGACQSQRYTPATFPGKQLSFGSGGGFTGQVVEYTLLENGQLFQNNTLTREVKQLHRVNRQKSQWAFAEAEKLNLNKLSFSHPGNMYYFIQLKQGETSHRATWGNPTEMPPPALETFYKQLIAEIIHS